MSNSKDKKNKEDEDENYLYTDKNEIEIFDDLNLFKNNWPKKKNENNDKCFEKNYEGKKK